MLDWVVGFGIEYSDGGAPAKLDALSRQLRTVNPLFERLTPAVKGSASGIWDLGAAAKAATPSLAGLDTVTRAQTASARASASATRAQAAAMWDLAAASAAVVTSSRSSAAVAAGGGFAASAAGGRASRVVAASSFGSAAFAAPVVLPAAMRWAGGQTASGAPLALAGGGRGGWVSPWAAGLMGAVPGGPGGPSGPRAMPFGRRWGSGGSGGGGAGGFGGGSGGGGGTGGGAGGFGAPLISPGSVGHMAMRGVKYGAEAGLGLMWDAVHEAAKFQTILQSTQNVTGANAAQMARARQAAFDVGNENAMSPIQVAEMFRDLSRQSQGSMSFSDMLTMLPQMAKMQVVLGAARGFSPHQTVDSVMALTHLFRQYDPKGQSKMFDTVLRMGELMPDNLQRAVTQMTYFEPLLKSLNVPDEEAAASMVALSRFGMGKGKGGTNLRALILESLPKMLQTTKHAQGAKLGLMREIGLIDAHGQSTLFKEGGLGGKKWYDIFGFFDKLSAYALKHDPSKVVPMYYSLFGKQAGNVGALMADPVIVDALKKIHETIKNQKSLGLGAQANTIFGTAQLQEKRAWNNFQAIATEVGSYALPGITKGFKDAATAMRDTQHWLRDHPELGKGIEHTITDGVKGAERYIITHKKDWIAFGNDIGSIARQAKRAAPDIMHLADSIGGLYNSARDISAALDDVNKKAQQSGRDAGNFMRDTVVPTLIPGADRKTQDAYNAWLAKFTLGVLKTDLNRPFHPTRSLAGYGDFQTKPAALPAGGMRALLGSYDSPHESRRQKTVRVDHHHHHDLHLHGGGSVVKDEVRRVLGELLTEGGGPRVATGRHATINTDPYQPSRFMTVNPA